MDKNVSLRARKIRDVLGLTKQEMADKLGVSPKTIQNIELNGVLSASTHIAYEEKLNVHPDYFYQHSKYMFFEMPDFLDEDEAEILEALVDNEPRYTLKNAISEKAVDYTASSHFLQDPGRVIRISVEDAEKGDNLDDVLALQNLKERISAINETLLEYLEEKEQKLGHLPDTHPDIKEITKKIAVLRDLRDKLIHEHYKLITKLSRVESFSITEDAG